MKKKYFQKMSLSLLKAELDAATKELKTAVKGETDEQERSSVKGGKRKREGGLEKNIKKKGVNFKFASDFVGKEDRTAECLAALEMLDRGSKVKAGSMHMTEERRRGGDTGGKKKKEEEGTLFTEEDFANFEKDLFLHSKPRIPKRDD